MADGDRRRAARCPRHGQRLWLVERAAVEALAAAWAVERKTKAAVATSARARSGRRRRRIRRRWVRAVLVRLERDDTKPHQPYNMLAPGRAGHVLHRRQLVVRRRSRPGPLASVQLPQDCQAGHAPAFSCARRGQDCTRVLGTCVAPSALRQVRISKRRLLCHLHGRPLRGLMPRPLTRNNQEVHTSGHR